MILSIKQFRAVKNLDLEFEPGKLYGIFGNGGSGKTTIVQAIPVVLTGTVPSDNNLSRLPVAEYKFSHKDKHYIKLDADRFSIDTEFNGHIDGTPYTDTNSEKSERKQLFQKFFGIDDLNSEQLSRLLVSKLYIPDFALSIANMKPTERAEHFLSLFGVEFMSQLIQTAREELKMRRNKHQTLSAQCSVYEDMVVVSDSDKLKKDLAELSEGLDESLSPDNLEATKHLIEANKQTLVSSEGNLRDLEATYEQDLKKSCDSNTITQKYRDKEDAARRDCANKARDLFFPENFDHTGLENLDTDIISVREEITEINQLMLQLEDQINNSKECPRCSTRLMVRDRLEIFDATEAAKTLSGYRTQKSSKEKTLNALLKTKEHRDNKSKYVELEDKLKRDLAELKRNKADELSQIEDKKVKLKVDFESAKRQAQIQITEQKQKVASLELKLTRILEHKEIFEKIRELESALKLAEQQKEKLKKFQILRNEEALLSKEIAEINELVTKIYPRLRSEIIMQKSGLLSSEINNILVELQADSAISFEFLKDGEGAIKGVDFQCNNNGRVTDFRSLNGSEKNMITTACVIGQTRVYPHPLQKVNTLIFDDYFGRCDREHDELFAEFLHGIRDQAVIITSARDEIREIFQPDESITMEKQNGVCCRIR